MSGLNRWTANPQCVFRRTEGSNPSLSAMFPRNSWFHGEFPDLTFRIPHLIVKSDVSVLPPATGCLPFDEKGSVAATLSAFFGMPMLSVMSVSIRP